MPAIKFYLEPAEYDAVERFVSGLKVTPEAGADRVLDRLMLDARDPILQAEVVQTAAWLRDHLPPASDSAAGPPGHEGQAHEDPVSSKNI